MLSCPAASAASSAGSALAPVGPGQRARLRDRGVAAGIRECAQVARLEQRAVDREHERHAGRRRAQPGDEPGERRLHADSVVAHRERQLRGIVLSWRGRLAEREPLVAHLAEQPPGALGERLVAEARERLG